MIEGILLDLHEKEGGRKEEGRRMTRWETSSTDRKVAAQGSFEGLVTLVGVAKVEVNRGLQ